VARLRHARATSAGGVVIRTAGDRRQLLLGRRARERARDIWSLPKGTPDAGERLDQTALREVSEETGLRVRIVAPLGEIHYWFVRDGTRYAKTVHYYLMEPVGGDLAAHDREFEEVRWIDLDEVPGLELFPSERELVERARRRLAATRQAPVREGRALP
jgi:8-oxo-dGTP pyrophosphatase MutT (NUDIX family)